MVRDHLTNVEEFCVNPGSAGERSRQRHKKRNCTRFRLRCNKKAPDRNLT